MGKRSNWMLVVLLGVLAVGSMAPAGAASAAACQVDFVATFDPPLSGPGNTVQGGAPQKLTITGTQTCPGMTPSTADVSVGATTFTTPATDPGDIAAGITEYTWQDPAGTLVGGCINNTTTAFSIARWSDGSVSVIDYTTNSLTYGIELRGTGVASAPAVAVNRAPGQPATYAVTATRDVGAVVTGFLVAGASTPTGVQEAFSACSGSGLATVSLTGVETFVTAP